MSDLNTVKELIAKGDKEQTIRLLASILLKNTSDLEAWMLLGELLDEPSKKRACYKQVLRLSPDHLLAIKKLQELDAPRPAPPDPPPVTNSRKARAENQSSLEETRESLKVVPYQEPYPPANSSTDSQEIILFLVVGIAAFLMILFILISPADPSGDTAANNDALWAVLISFAVIAFIFIIFSASNKHRG